MPTTASQDILPQRPLISCFFRDNHTALAPHTMRGHQHDGIVRPPPPVP